MQPLLLPPTSGSRFCFLKPAMLALQSACLELASDYLFSASLGLQLLPLLLASIACLATFAGGVALPILCKKTLTLQRECLHADIVFVAVIHIVIVSTITTDSMLTILKQHSPVFASDFCAGLSTGTLVPETISYNLQ